MTYVIQRILIQRTNYWIHLTKSLFLSFPDSTGRDGPPLPVVLVNDQAADSFRAFSDCKPFDLYGIRANNRSNSKVTRGILAGFMMRYEGSLNILWDLRRHSWDTTWTQSPPPVRSSKGMPLQVTDKGEAPSGARKRRIFFLSPTQATVGGRYPSSSRCRQVRGPYRHKFGAGAVPPEIGETVHLIADHYVGHLRGDGLDNP
jgi:hypothetical protein